MRFVFLIVFLLTVSCSGGDIVVAGNPTRPVTGKARAAGDSVCFADEVRFSNTAAKIVTASVDDTDCDFTATLASERLWKLKFYNDGVLVAGSAFESGVGSEPQSYYYHDLGDTELDLGFFEVEGLTATATLNPYLSSDQDDDGIADYEDSDDDNDGLLDTLEEDCDGDGVIDDLDLDSDC